MVEWALKSVIYVSMNVDSAQQSQYKILMDCLVLTMKGRPFDCKRGTHSVTMSAYYDYIIIISDVLMYTFLLIM